MDAFTPRNVAKFVTKTIIAGQAAQLTTNTITDHTQFEEDDTIVEIGSGLVGWYVADKLKPVTDSMIDKAADWLNARKAAKQQDTAPVE